MGETTQKGNKEEKGHTNYSTLKREVHQEKGQEQDSQAIQDDRTSCSLSFQNSPSMDPVDTRHQERKKKNIIEGRRPPHPKHNHHNSNFSRYSDSLVRSRHPLVQSHLPWAPSSKPSTFSQILTHTTFLLLLTIVDIIECLYLGNKLLF